MSPMHDLSDDALAALALDCTIPELSPQLAERLGAVLLAASPITGDERAAARATLARLARRLEPPRSLLDYLASAAAPLWLPVGHALERFATWTQGTLEPAFEALVWPRPRRAHWGSSSLAGATVPATVYARGPAGARDTACEQIGAPDYDGDGCLTLVLALPRAGCDHAPHLASGQGLVWLQHPEDAAVKGSTHLGLLAPVSRGDPRVKDLDPGDERLLLELSAHCPRTKGAPRSAPCPRWMVQEFKLFEGEP